MLRNIACLLQPREHAGPLPTVNIDQRGDAVMGEYPWNIFVKSPAGNMHHATHVYALQQLAHLFDVDAGRREKLIEQGFVGYKLRVFQHFANQRVAIAVRA